MIRVALPDGASVRVRSLSGSVTAVAEPRTDVEVTKGDSETEGEELVISGERGLSGSIEMRVPEGTALTIGTASGSVTLSGRFGRVRVSTKSGSIKLDASTGADLRTWSGRIEVGTCASLCRAKTKSGHVEIGQAGLADISTVSGRVSVGTVGKKLRVATASGSVEASCEGPADATVKTMSGSVKLCYPDGVQPNARVRSLKGKRSVECSPGSDCTVDVTTVTGRIEVKPR